MAIADARRRPGLASTDRYEMRRRRFRFSLASLVGLMTLAAIVFGYAKWEYQRRRHDYEWLKSAGAELATDEVKATWMEFIATGRSTLEKPKSLYRIVIYQLDDSRFRAGTHHVNGEEVCNLVRTIFRRTRHLDAYFPKMVLRGEPTFDQRVFNQLLKLSYDEFDRREKGAN
jgi:hypothetical protein